MTKDYSGWIEHVAGEKRPVPIEWIKAVKDCEGCVFYDDESFSAPEGVEVTYNDKVSFKEYISLDVWDGTCPPEDTITHFKLKDEFIVDYTAMKDGVVAAIFAVEDKSNEEKHKRYNPGKSIMKVFEDATINGTITEVINLSCDKSWRSIELEKSVYDKGQNIYDHWLMGGVVEFEHFDLKDRWLDVEQEELAELPIERLRIKQREPVVGEVWEVDVGTDCGDENYLPVVWLMDDGFLRAYFFTDTHADSHNDLSDSGADWTKRYIASSIKEFYCS